MMKKFGLSLFVLIAGLSFPLRSQVLYEQTIKFGKVLEWIDNYYVDTVNQEKLVETAIVQLLKELDPHSSYLSKEEVEEMNEPLQGNFEGIGISFNILKDTIFIISVCHIRKTTPCLVDLVSIVQAVLLATRKFQKVMD